MSFSNDFPRQLRQRLAEPLPGRAAQWQMASLRRMTDSKLYEKPPAKHKIAAVLALIFQKNGQWHTALIERTAHAADRHSGQISFPGGKMEPSDSSLAITAVREAEEEIGVPRHAIQILGNLTDLYIPVSNFLVHPFVGWLPDALHFAPQPTEVRQILQPPLSLFLEKNTRKMRDITLSQGIQLQDVPYFDVDGKVVWGATAMILSEFAHILMEIQNEKISAAGCL